MRKSKTTNFRTGQKVFFNRTLSGTEFLIAEVGRAGPFIIEDVRPKKNENSAGSQDIKLVDGIGWYNSYWFRKPLGM